MDRVPVSEKTETSEFRVDKTNSRVTRTSMARYYEESTNHNLIFNLFIEFTPITQRLFYLNMNMNESYCDTKNIPLSCVSFASASILSTRTLHETPRIPLRHTAADRRMLVYLSAFCTFFFAGASFGWGPMQLMLENQGIYHSLCSADYGDGDTTCPDQAARLLNM